MNALNLFWQYRGLEDGYDAAVAEGRVPSIPHFAFAMLNGCGDLFQIIPAVRPSSRPDFSAMSFKEAVKFDRDHSMCSALIKVTPDFSDIMVGHSSWFVYGNMNRIYKTYTLPVAQSGSGAYHSVVSSFSSYFGYLESLDDFYMSTTGKGNQGEIPITL